MNYISLLKSLFAEVKLSIQHRNLGTALNILVTVALIPYYLLLALYMLTYLVLTFFYNACASAVNALECWVDERKKDLHPAGEAVFIFCTTPFIFLCNILLSIFAVWYYFLWFFMQATAFFATSGSTEWRPFIHNAHKNLEKTTDWKITTKPLAALIFVIAALVLFAVSAILFLVYFAGEDVYTAYSAFSLLYNLLVLIATPLIFKKTVATDDEEKAEEAPAEPQEADTVL